MISQEDLQRCAEIEYDCWKENYAPMLKISEYLYYQTKTSLKKDFSIIKNSKKSSSKTLVAQGFRRA